MNTEEIELILNKSLSTIENYNKFPKKLQDAFDKGILNNVYERSSFYICIFSGAVNYGRFENLLREYFNTDYYTEIRGWYDNPLFEMFYVGAFIMDKELNILRATFDSYIPDKYEKIIKISSTQLITKSDKIKLNHILKTNGIIIPYCYTRNSLCWTDLIKHRVSSMGFYDYDTLIGIHDRSSYISIESISRQLNISIEYAKLFNNLQCNKIIADAKIKAAKIHADAIIQAAQISGGGGSCVGSSSSNKTKVIKSSTERLIENLDDSLRCPEERLLTGYEYLKD